MAARVRGLCTVLVTKSGAVEDCHSRRIPEVENSGATLGYRDVLALADMMLTLCRNSDLCLRASQPEPPASSSAAPGPRSRLRPDDS